MPTISSRPEEQRLEEIEFTPDEIVDLIADAVLYGSPSNQAEVQMCLTVICRTLWSAGDIIDFFVYGTPGGGFDVGFKMPNDPNYIVLQIS